MRISGIYLLRKRRVGFGIFAPCSKSSLLGKVFSLLIVLLKSLLLNGKHEKLLQIWWNRIKMLDSGSINQITSCWYANNNVIALLSVSVTILKIGLLVTWYFTFSLFSSSLFSRQILFEILLTYCFCFIFCRIMTWASSSSLTLWNQMPSNLLESDVLMKGQSMQNLSIQSDQLLLILGTLGTSLMR